MQGLSGIAIIVLAAWVGMNRLDHDLLFATLGDIDPFHLACASLAIIGVMAMSTARFAVINKKVGGDEDWLFLHRVNMLSLLYGQIALPLIAQIIGRINHGSAERRVYYAPLTILEKSVAFTIMILFGGIAAYLLLYQNIIPEGLESALALMACAITAVILASIYFFFTPDERRKLIAPIRKVAQIGIIRTLGFSILIQFGILFIYTILAVQFVPDTELIILVGGFAIVVLVTSIPIGFGGWGVRETAAATIFIALGLPPEIGVVVGLLYGMLHLIILVASVLILRGRTVSRPAPSLTVNTFHGIDFWPVTFFLMMALLPFQIRLPLAEDFITLNSVDLLALIVMINFTIIQLLKGQLNLLWVDRFTWLGLIGLVVMLIMGWFVGWFRFGSNEWATTNRLMGLIIVLSYLFSGAAMCHYLTPALLRKLGLVFVFSIVTSVIVKVLAYNVFKIDASIFFNWESHVKGFITDRNAFSFMSAFSAIFLAFYLGRLKSDDVQQRIAVILLAVLMTLTALTGSRSGFGAMVFIAIWMCWSMPKHIPVMAITIAATYAISSLILTENFTIESFTILADRNLREFFVIHDLRANSWRSGYEFFLEYPIFGAGLGAGIRETGLVIHNLYLWILGEMGLVGLLLCMPMVLAFVRTAQHYLNRPGLPFKHHADLHGFVLFIIICGGFSLVQDIAYQRVLWLMVGFMLARPMLAQKNTEKQSF
jgi:O-antigen ligase